ncbi:ABC transporter substrate-binding protein [Microbacteriaceae bacterium 4G12]
MPEVPLITVPGSRPFSRRVLLTGLGLGAAGMTLGLTGCAPQGSSRTAIRFVQNKREVIGYFSDLVDRFNESQSEILVRHDDSPVSLVAQMVRGSYPDVACYNYNLEASTFLGRGMLSDLSDLPEAATVQASVQDLVTQYAQYEDQTNVLPFSITAAGVVYNRDLFAQNNVEVPTTWSEFTAACAVFRDAGIIPIYGTFRDMWTVSQGHFDYAAGGLMDVADFYDRLRDEGPSVGPNSETSFQKDFAQVAERMSELFDFSQENALTRAYPDGNAAFANGEAAMYLQGPWAIGEVNVINGDANIGTFPLPMTEDPEQTRTRVNLDLAVWIPNGVANRDQSVAFLQYLMSPEVLNTYNQENLAYSTLENAPPVTDPRIQGLQEAYTEGRFYQGAGTYLPNTIPLQNYLQEFVIDREAQPFLAKLDTDWARLSQRTDL